MDLVSETFAAAFVGRWRFRGSTEADVAAFLHGIARRQLSHWYRTGAVRRRALGRLGLERPVLDDAELARIDELASSAAERAAVRAALTELSEEHRAALQLRVVEERQYSEIAALLDVSEQTARARVSRALRALGRNLELAELTL